MELKGIYPIVPTPFLDNGEVDYPSVERLIDCMVEKRVQGLAIMGALGEGPKMTDSERNEIIKTYRKHMPTDMHLVVGTRAPATDPAKLQAEHARDQGQAAGIVAVRDEPLIRFEHAGQRGKKHLHFRIPPRAGTAHLSDSQRAGRS